MKPNISKETEKFLTALLQLEENFGRLFSIERIFKRHFNEKTIDMNQIKRRIDRYDILFDTMIDTAPAHQDWEFVEGYLKDALNEVDTYFDWITDIGKNDIQITENEVKELTRFKEIIERQLNQIQLFLG